MVGDSSADPCEASVSDMLLLRWAGPLVLLRPDIEPRSDLLSSRRFAIMARCILALRSAKSTRPGCGTRFFSGAVASALDASLLADKGLKRLADLPLEALVVANETGCLGLELLNGGDFCGGSALMNAFTLSPVRADDRCAAASYLLAERVGKLEAFIFGFWFSTALLPLLGERSVGK